MLELFSGTKIMSETFKAAGYKVFTVDINPDLKPDLAINILDFQLKDLPKEFRNPRVVWASPPCNSFTVLTIGRYWYKPNYPKHHRACIGMALALKTLELIKQLRPKYWFIENPRAMLRKLYFMRDLPRKTVTYCQYGEQWRKPTDIFTNAIQWIPKKCNAGDSCHIKVKRGEAKGIKTPDNDLSKIYNWDGSGSIIRAKLPAELCKEIVKVCENKLSMIQKTINPA